MKFVNRTLLLLANFFLMSFYLYRYIKFGRTEVIQPIFFNHYYSKHRNNCNVPVFCGIPKTNISSMDRVKSLTLRLESKLKTNNGVNCFISDYKEYIPKNANNEKTIQALEKLFHASKFFSRIAINEEKFGKNFNFALKMSDLSEIVTDLIKKNTNFESVLEQLEHDYTNETDKYRIKHFLYKTGYRGESAGIPPDTETVTHMSRYTYGEDYFERFSGFGFRTVPYKGFALTEKGFYGLAVVLRHPTVKQVDKNMQIITDRYKVFQSLVTKYKNTKELNSEQTKEVDDIISEIYYLMANTCPYFQGTNGMCDILMRSMYAVFGIDKPHIKQGISLDLESFCMDLDCYKNNWNSCFEE